LRFARSMSGRIFDLLCIWFSYCKILRTGRCTQLANARG
jgi:hypothetical protein